MRRTLAAIVIAFAVGGCASLRTPMQLTDEEAASPATLSIGDPAPPLSISEWVRGPESPSFLPGKVYLIDFWATWCGPCIASMGRTGRLQDAHPDSLIIIALTSEDRGNSRARIREHAASHPGRVRIAIDRGTQTTDTYRRAAREGGIPVAFLIDERGRIAWIGHPADAPPVVEATLAGTWNVEAAARNRKDFETRRARADKLNADARAAQQAGDDAAHLEALNQLVRCGLDAVRWSPKHAAWTMRIDLCRKLGHRDEALRIAEETLRTFPENGSAHAWTASALIPLDHDRAGAIAERAEQLLIAEEAKLGTGDDWDLWLAEGTRESLAVAYQNLAGVWYRKGNPGRAADLQRKAISLIDAESYPDYTADMRKALGVYEGKK